MTKYKRGDIVFYTTGNRSFGAAVDCDPWTLGDGHEVVNLDGLGDEYRAYTGVSRRRVNAAACRCLRPAPTEYVEGEWVIPTADGGEPAAVITYAFEPGAETGHEGWCWWALGKMGEAPSYEQARAAAEEVIRGAI